MSKEPPTIKSSTLSKALVALQALLRDARGDLGRRITGTLFVRIGMMGLQAVVAIILARILGPSGRGLFATAAAISGIGVQLGTLGLNSANTYFAAQDRGRVSGLIANTLVATLAVGLATVFVFGVLSILVPQALPLEGLLLWLAALAIPIGIGRLLLQGIQLGIEQVRAFNAIEILSSATSLTLLATLIAVQHVTVELAYTMTVAASLVALIATWRMLKAGQLKSRALFDAQLLRRSLPYGAKAYIACLFAYLVVRSDVLMVKYMLGEEQVGYYSAAVSIGDLLYLLPTIAGMIIFPRLTAAKDDLQRLTLVRGVIMALAITILPAAIVLVVGRQTVIQLLFGEAYLPAAAAVLWLLPGIVMLSFNTIFMNYFASKGMPMVAVWSPFAACIVNLALNVVLLPAFGFPGAAISSTVAYGLMLGVSAVYLVWRKESEKKTITIAEHE